MSASAEQLVNTTLYRARARRLDLALATKREREATVAYIDEALHSGWGWERIGGALEISGTAARRYYARNRRKVRSV